MPGAVRRRSVLLPVAGNKHCRMAAPTRLGNARCDDRFGALSITRRFHSNLMMDSEMTQSPPRSTTRVLDRNGRTTSRFTPFDLHRAHRLHLSGQGCLIHGERRFTWLQTYGRCRPSGLRAQGARRYGDTVSVILNNARVARVPLPESAIGAVLNTINTRLDAESIAFILNHAGRRC